MEPPEVIDDLLAAGAPVRRVTLHRVSLPLRQALRSSHGVEHRRESTIVGVELVDDTVGWGECVALARPTYSSEYADGAYRALRDLFVPALFDAAAPDRGADGSETVTVGQPMAAAALEGAVLDARLRSSGRSLADALGATRRAVATAAVVGRAVTIDELLETVGELVARSIAAVSLKIGPGWDLEPVRAVHDTWPELALGADGNGAYGPGDLDHLDAVARAGLSHLEQPLPADDLVGLAGLRQVVEVPVALDESVTSRGTLESAVRLGAADAVNVKPARLGGTRAALDIVRVASDEGLALYCGGMLETGIGRAHALAVAALEELTWPTHLGPSDRYFDADLTEPFVLRSGGLLDVPSGPGIGVVPDEHRLTEVEVDRVVMSAEPPP